VTELTKIFGLRRGKSKGTFHPITRHEGAAGWKEGSRGIALPILNFGARWVWVVNATPWLLCPAKKSPGTHCT
jgi:hypothetical protein